MAIPTQAQLEHGCAVFRQHEARDAMYRIAIFLVDHFWGRAADMADSLGVLLLTWNSAFYRYGSFDFAKLERCITTHLHALATYRERNILDYTARDDAGIETLFNDLLFALAIAEGEASGRQSPVSVAKALHLLAPGFFPLWDKEIASEYGCNYAVKGIPRAESCLERPIVRNGTPIFGREENLWTFQGAAGIYWQ